MTTNIQIHELATKGYAKRTGKEKIGWSVYWEVRRTATGEVKIANPESELINQYAERDCAGHFNKADAVRLAKTLVKDGYTGVSINKVHNCNGRAWDDNRVMLSPDWTPTKTPVEPNTLLCACVM